jgi:hypothetical protein
MDNLSQEQPGPNYDDSGMTATALSRKSALGGSTVPNLGRGTKVAESLDGFMSSPLVATEVAKI